MSGSLLDTSFVIAVDEPDAIPANAAISVITLGALQAGVALARDEQVRTLRRRRLVYVRARFEPVAIDEPIAERYGDLLALARSRRRSEKATDLLIVATAAATDRVLHTFDQGQAELARLAGVNVS